MKNYVGIIFFIAWTYLYFIFFNGLLSELGVMLLWFLVWIFLALPWGILSIFGIIDDNQVKIKFIFYQTKFGRYFMFLLGVLLLLYAVALLLFLLYKLVFLSEINLIQLSIGLFVSFFSLRTGYRIITHSS